MKTAGIRQLTGTSAPGVRPSLRTGSWHGGAGPKRASRRLVLFGAAVLALSGCWRGATSSRAPWHPNPNMDLQPKYRAQSASDFFYDGATMRPPVEGAVARGELHEDTAFYTGADESGELVAAIPFEVDEALVDRGRERFEIYCAVCHDARGTGKGVLWDRAQIASANLHEERLKDIPDGQMFDVITNGLGLMSGYKYPIPPRDRWAIIAYVRRLQSEAGR